MSEDTRVPRLLSVMAHPDDTEILVGGTMFNLKEQGWELGIVTVTADDCGSPSLRPDEIARIRYAEAHAAADFLGAWYACAGLMDVEVFANAGNLRRVIDVVRRFDPDVVITHSPVDYMLDHEEASRLVRGVTFALAIPNYPSRQNPPAMIGRAIPALYYADPLAGMDPLGQRIYPHFYVDISKQLLKKREMLSRHTSQREWLRSHQGIDEYLGQMTQWAAGSDRECGFEYAEGFRQHLGHGYPHEPILQKALGTGARLRGETN
jgi:LmbE family N-acetylglucosaminyl deacetylase